MSYSWVFDSPTLHCDFLIFMKWLAPVQHESRLAGADKQRHSVMVKSCEYFFVPQDPNLNFRNDLGRLCINLMWTWVLSVRPW